MFNKFNNIPAVDMKLGKRDLDFLIAPLAVQLGIIDYFVVEAMPCSIHVITTAYFTAPNNNVCLVHIKYSGDIELKNNEIVFNKKITLKKTKEVKMDVQEFSWNIVSNKMRDIFNS